MICGELLRRDVIGCAARLVAVIVGNRKRKQFDADVVVARRRRERQLFVVGLADDRRVPARRRRRRGRRAVRWRAGVAVGGGRQGRRRRRGTLGRREPGRDGRAAGDARPQVRQVAQHRPRRSAAPERLRAGGAGLDRRRGLEVAAGVRRCVREPQGRQGRRCGVVAGRRARLSVGLVHLYQHVQLRLNVVHLITTSTMLLLMCVQRPFWCSDAVGWAAGKASGL